MANYDQKRCIFIYFLFFVCFTYTNNAYQFIVGGRDGWILNPPEKYNHWAERLRFQVNDTLIFKYKKGSDSVLVVNKDDYNRCNTGNPIEKFNDGNSIFKFDQSGPFFFVTGNKSNCDKGQKMIIVVLAIRYRHSPPPIQAEPPSSVPAVSPLAPSPAPATTQYGPNTPGGVNVTSGSPPRRSFAPPGGTPSVFITSAVSLVFGVGLVGFVTSP